jgi:hypothetical protein
VSREVWLPLATLVLGYVGSLCTEWFRDRRAEGREKFMREAEVADRRANREADFQRETLLRIQDALFAQSQATTIHQLHYIAAERRGQSETPPRDVPWGNEGEVPDNMGKQWQESASELILLTVRVADDELRGVIDQFRSHTTAVILALGQDAAFKAAAKADDVYKAANERIGQLLRERY